MKTEDEIRQEIVDVTERFSHVLTIYPASVEINSPRALMQHSAITQLDVLYDILGEKRPRFKCDEFDKMNQ